MKNLQFFLLMIIVSLSSQSMASPATLTTTIPSTLHLTLINTHVALRGISKKQTAHGFLKGLYPSIKHSSSFHKTLIRFLAGGALATYTLSKLWPKTLSSSPIFSANTSQVFAHSASPSPHKQGAWEGTHQGESNAPEGPSSPMVPLWTTDKHQVEEQSLFFDQERSIEEEKASQKEVWDLFQSHYFHSHFYDTHHLSPPHPELITLIHSYLALTRAQTLKLLKSMKTPLKRPVFNEEDYHRWFQHPEFLTRFISSKLTTIKELHLFLRLLFDSAITPLDITEHYGENPTILDRRTLKIVSLMRDYQGDTYDRPAPVKEKFWNLTAAKPIIESLGYHRLEQRLSDVMVREGTRLLDMPNLKQIRSQDAAAFYEQLQDPKDQQLFLDHIVKLTDAPPISPHSKSLKYLASHFASYLISPKKPKKVLAIPKLQQDFEVLSDQQILTQVDNSKLFKRQRLSLYPYFQAKTITDFSKLHLKDDLDKTLFFTKFLDLDSLSLEDMAHHFAKSEKAVERRYRQLKNIFLNMLKKKSTALIPYSQGQLSLSDLQNLFAMLMNTEREDITQRLTNSLKNSTDKNLPYLEKPEILERYVSLALESDAIKHHIFLSLILKLDQTDMADIHFTYNTPLNEIRSMYTSLSSLLVEIGHYGNIKPEIVHRPLSFKQDANTLKVIFDGYDRQGVIDTLKINILNMEQLAEDHYGYLSKSIHSLTLESIDDFTENILAQDSLGWHLWHTYFLKLGDVSLSGMARLYNINQATVVAYKNLLLTKALTIFLKNSGTLEELSEYIEKDYQSSKERYENLTQEEIIIRIEESPLFHLGHETTITEDHLQSFLNSRFFTSPRVDTQKIREHVFYHMLTISQASRLELAIGHGLDNNYFIRRHIADTRRVFQNLIQ